MEKRVAKKIMSFRISEEFEHFLEGIWRTNAFREIGIKSKTDLLRYSVLNVVGKQHGIKTLKKFDFVDEVNNYLNPKTDENVEELYKNIKEYSKNRKKGGS